MGCSSAPAPTGNAETPATSFSFHADHYPAVHAATVEVLREHGFTIDRNDYRFGVVTTKPREAPTAVEFWIDDPTTPAQHRGDTLNAHQRTVKAMVERSGEDRLYELRVEIITERLQRPARYLTHSATPRISAQYAAAPDHLNDRGITGPYAQTLTRDPHLEARLINAIRQRVLDAP